MQRDELIAIMLADHERYQTRQAREDAILAHDSESRAGLAEWSCERPLLRGIGMVGTSGANRRYPRQAPRARAHGAAAMPRTADEAELLASGQVEDTVLCYNVNDPSNVTVRTVREIRSNGRDTKNRAPVTSTPAQVADTARFSTGHDFTN